MHGIACYSIAITQHSDFVALTRRGGYAAHALTQPDEFTVLTQRVNCTTFTSQGNFTAI